ncbi:putative ribonuclease H-like domain-containing protein, partial [Tanacetum coccineum]
TEESISAGHSSKETRFSQDYILMPLWKDDSLFDSYSKNDYNDEPQPSSDARKKDDEGVCKESGIANQEKPENNTQEAMQDELLQFKLQKVWTLVDLPYGKRAIGTKWVYRNKKDERVARIEAIMLFLAYASFMNFVVYQMDVKSAFLYGKIEEEVYVYQPLGFEDPKFLD